MTTPEGPSQIRVICVTYNPGSELDDLARSLVAATALPIDLVLVDNGSAGQYPETVAARHGGRVLRAGENLGYGRAANLGAMGGDEPWLLVVNPDIVWKPGALDVLLAAAERHPRAGALGPALLNPDGSVYPSARELPSLTQGVGHALFARLWPHNPWTRSYQARQESATSTERYAGWLSGACLLLRREAFEQVGGFDATYFMFFEDVDLGERLGAAGWQNLYVPAAEAVHVGGTSWRDKPARMISAHHASARHYLHHRYDRWFEWPVRVAITIGLGLRERIELRAAR
ncbi:glycosyltransferase family 2 protein [Pengzhenrongella frigida]|uniref:Glycosyltransferase family 2 protein n=1 Tax=Pengzhenrongella frigida TaxID=1259133 RepID=A0A4V1ZHA8_9MICO|nr:glycosyltransferase family 2 protein [Cellulomonas sp. HLT2-17]RYV51394.1 glycosyltransferase family 2 protein [Cellulomonas sp. HLT2-17]